MEEIAKRVFHLPLMLRNGVNAYVIGNVLIDSGNRRSHKTILKQLGGHTLKAHALTHGHSDHQGSSQILCERLNIPLWTGANEAARVESGDALAEYPKQRHLVTWYQRTFWAGQGHPVSRTLREDDDVEGFRVIETPGNTSGHVSYFREEDGVLIVGDTLVNMNLITTAVRLSEPPSFFNFDTDLNRKSILKLAALRPKILCCGHGPVLRNRGELERYVERLV
jgi:glyoxylase-like metal-dependent hydrolase (beta-lactamase superfamily II)